MRDLLDQKRICESRRQASEMSVQSRKTLSAFEIQDIMNKNKQEKKARVFPMSFKGILNYFSLKGKRRECKTIVDVYIYIYIIY